MQINFLKTLKAMSFAELVVVMAVIGTITALTLPGLKKYSQKTELGEQAKKVYLTLEDALDNAVLTQGPIRSWSFSTPKGYFAAYIEPNIKYTSVNLENATLTTVDGAKITVTSCDDDYCIIEADVNGSKYPNVVGKDIFTFRVTKDGNDEYYLPESLRPEKGTVGEILMQHGWKFSDNLWKCNSQSISNGNCQY